MHPDILLRVPSFPSHGCPSFLLSPGPSTTIIKFPKKFLFFSFVSLALHHDLPKHTSFPSSLPVIPRLNTYPPIHNRLNKRNMSTSTPTGDISNPMPSTAAGVTTDPPGQNGKSFTFIVEHLDPELGPWSALEYKTIARECREFCNQFFLSSISKDLVESGVLADVVAEGGEVERRAVEVVFPPRGGGSVADARDVQAEGRGGERICLLDPRGEKELCPEDGERFEGFLFGGILGIHLPFNF